jgi:serine protease Do
MAMQRSELYKSLVLIAVTMVAGMALGAWAVSARAGVPILGSTKTVPLLMSSAAAATGEVSLETGFQPVVESALPAVVNISSDKRTVVSENQPSTPFFFFDPFFGDRFGDRGSGMPRERRERSLGSGVIVSSEGYLLTNNHVVEGAEKISVSLSDGREMEAKLVGQDPKTDIAVLKLDATDLPVLPLGDSDQVGVGQFALAIGNPFGVGETVTLGIVSATGRKNLRLTEGYEDFIQTDAAINPGNSGGALINARGELIGINTAIISRGGGNQGVGFAVPINLARYVMEQILEHGRVVRGWLGVSIQPVDAKMARALDLKEERGVLIGGVEPGSPAEQAGVEQGDVILRLNDDEVNDPSDLSLKVSMTPPGETVSLEVLRGEDTQTLRVKLGERPDEDVQASAGSGASSDALAGVVVGELTPEIKRRLGVPSSAQGVVITSVAPGSPAAEAGLRTGDVIESVNRRPTSSVRDFEREAGRADEAALLLIRRGGQSFYVALETR